MDFAICRFSHKVFITASNLTHNIFFYVQYSAIVFGIIRIAQTRGHSFKNYRYSNLYLSDSHPLNVNHAGRREKERITPKLLKVEIGMSIVISIVLETVSACVIGHGTCFLHKQSTSPVNIPLRKVQTSGSRSVLKTEVLSLLNSPLSGKKRESTDSKAQSGRLFLEKPMKRARPGGPRTGYRY